MKPCLFCGRTDGRATNEHVIPQWARKAFQVRGPLRLYLADEPGARSEIPTRSLPHLNILLKDAICGECNTVHLSKLESAVSPILSPMVLSHEATSLDPLDQRLIATWAVKTVWLMERAVQAWFTRPSVPGYLASEAEFAWLWARREPPPRSLVWLSCWDCDQTTPVMYEPSGVVLPTVDGGSVVGHLTTFALGFVAIQVFGIDFVAAEKLGAEGWRGCPPAALASAISRIWPPQPLSIGWPGAAFPKQGWDRLVTWNDVLRGSPP